MNIAQIILAALGTAENIVSVFVHNPTSQKIEAIVVGEVNAITAALAGLFGKPPAATTSTPTAPASSTPAVPATD